jgi:uncharacterized membrane protein (DUF373 family)
MNTQHLATEDTNSNEENAPVGSRPAGDSGHGRWFPRNATRVFEQIEHWIVIGIGGLLSLAAVLALTGAVTLAWKGVIDWPEIRSLFGIVDRLLFVLMIIEILQTVRAAIQSRSHQLASEPFLIVGIIATVRRILVVTLETSDQTSGSQTAVSSVLTFEHAMIELGVLGVLTLVLATAIYLSRRAKA